MTANDVNPYLEEFPISRAVVRITFSNNEVWDIPVITIAQNRAEHYKEGFGNDLDRSLREDTLPLFQANDYEIEDWSIGNMNWSDCEDNAFRQADRVPPAVDKQSEWCGGEEVEREIIHVKTE